jgi:predicted nucleic acid-binding protein
VHIGLSFIGKLSLLQKRFPSGIIIPEAVWKEVVEEGKGKSGSLKVSSASWISVRKAKEKRLVDLLKSELDAGEAEANE